MALSAGPIATWTPQACVSSPARRSGLRAGRLQLFGSDRNAVQVVFVGTLDLDSDDIARPQGAARRNVDGAVDLRCIVLGPSLRDRRAGPVDDHRKALADLGPEQLRADL